MEFVPSAGEVFDPRLEMIHGRAAAVGIEIKLGNHSFRITGITAYLKNGGTLEKAAVISNHASTGTHSNEREAPMTRARISTPRRILSTESEA